MSTAKPGKRHSSRRGLAVSLLALSATFCCGVAVGVYFLPPNVIRSANEIESGDSPEETPRPESTATTGSFTTGPSYVVTTRRQSYFKLDTQGALELQEGLPYRSEQAYRFERTIHPHQTAVVVMDPWIDMASQHLNDYYGSIVESRIVRLVTLTLALGHPVIVLTNDPETVKYNTDIHPELSNLAAAGTIEVLYHQAVDDDQFASRLRTQGIDSLIYIGFASNMCVIGRRLGMIPMVHQGFRLFFVPQASAAVEYPGTWEDQSIHRATTKIISQWIAEVIDYDQLIHVLQRDS